MTREAFGVSERVIVKVKKGGSSEIVTEEVLKSLEYKLNEISELLEVIKNAIDRIRKG